MDLMEKFLNTWTVQAENRKSNLLQMVNLF